MKERLCDEWSTILFCANLLSMLATAAAAAVASAAAATTTTTTTATATTATTTSTTTNTTSTTTTTTSTATNVGMAVDEDSNSVDEVACPAIPTDSCSCYVFDENVFLECPSTTMAVLRKVLGAFAQVPLKLLHVYDLEASATTIKGDDFGRMLTVRQLHISFSHISHLNEDSFRYIRDQLESLAIVDSKLQDVPRKMLPYMTALQRLNFESNAIAELPDYSFYGLRLAELSLKGNTLIHIGEYAFAGLEDTLETADLSANQLTDFPTAAIRRLRQLTTLRLASNTISTVPDDGYSYLESLHNVDLSCNRFRSVVNDAFRPLPQLHTLSLHNNGIEGIHQRAFASLTKLQSLDLSHNRIVHMETSTFGSNCHLRTIDLSHNYVHHIGTLFAHLNELNELFLSENNLLKLPSNAFANATALRVIHLQRNALRHIDTHTFASSGGKVLALRQLHLSENFIESLANETLTISVDLESISLDHNNIVELQPATFGNTSQLRELHLHNNRVVHVRCGVFHPLYRLVELHLQHNAIADIETGAFSTLHSLQYVNLRGNMLRKLGNIFQPQAGSLVTVHLEGNRLTELDDTSLASQHDTEIVRLSRNQLRILRRIPFTNLRAARCLNVADNVIVSIEDGVFEAMQVLTQLDMSGNRLRTISATTFSGLISLRELHLAANRLEIIAENAFVQMGELKLLDLASNKLTALRAPLFHSNVPLERLLLANCQLTIIEQQLVVAFQQLRELDLRANQLSNDALSHLKSNSLHLLDLGSNNVTQLAANSLRGLPSLRELRIDKGRLAIVDGDAFLGNIHLETFSVRSNQLVQLPAGLFRVLRHVRRVMLDANYLTTLPDAVATAVSLRELSIAGNQIGGTVDVCKLQALRNLTDLDLSTNAIVAIGPGHRTMSAARVEQPHCNLTRLIRLNLAANQLVTLPTDAFHGAVSLRIVDLSANQFKHLPIASINRRNAPNLERLIFKNNPIYQICSSHGADPPNSSATERHDHQVGSKSIRSPLRELLISGCANLTAIATTDLEPFDRLASLYLVGNAINRISPSTFQSLSTLTALDLGRNRIAWLPPQGFRGLRRLRSLNLTRNALRTFHPFCDDLKALEILDLSHNRLVMIDRHAFHRLVNLTELQLRGNRIATIAADAFRLLDNLRTLDVASNELRSLPLDALKPLETRLQNLRVEENPLSCDCTQEEAWLWLRDHEKVATMSRGWSKNGGAPFSLRKIGEDDDSATASPATSPECEEPSELRGRHFLRMDASAFCATPLLVKIAVRNVQPYSVNVSWQAPPYSHVRAYKIVYNVLSVALHDDGEHCATATDGHGHGHDDREVEAEEESTRQDYDDDQQIEDEEDVDGSNSQVYNGTTKWVLLTRLAPATRYSICLSGLSGNQSSDGQKNSSAVENSNVTARYKGGVELLSPGKTSGEQAAWMLGDARWSRCVEVRTLDGASEEGTGNSSETTLLTRRLGLIVGSCMGCVVFVVLVAILVYTKVKKQRRTAKHQQPLPPEYLSYRHFSLRGCQQTSESHPSVATNPITIHQ